MSYDSHFCYATTLHIDGYILAKYEEFEFLIHFWKKTPMLYSSHKIWGSEVGNEIEQIHMC